MAEEGKDCMFCKISKGEMGEKIDEGENFFVINDANPVVDGHCLIISKGHYKTLMDLPVTSGSELLTMAKKHALRLIDEGKADGIKFVNNNYSAAGQGVFHFHFHVVPYKEGASVKGV